MLRLIALLAALLSTTTLAQAPADASLSPPPPPPSAATADAPPVVPAPAEPRLLSRGDTTRFRYAGGAVPAGFHLVEQPRWGLVAGGTAAFGLSTAFMVMISVAAANPLMAVPVIGQVVAFAELVRTSTGWFAGAGILLGGVVLLVDLAAQVAGITMFTIGLAKPSRWLERGEAPAVRVSLVPGASGAPLGASLVGRF